VTTLRYGELEAGYSVERTAGLTGKIRIHVRPEGQVNVEAPAEIDEAEIRAAVQKRARWIFKHIGAIDEARATALARVYVSGETHFYLGRRYPLKVIESKEERSGVRLRRGRIEVVARIADPAAIRRRLNDWCRLRAAEYFARRLVDVAGQMEWIETVPPLKVVEMGKQWGSCSPDGSIHLNPWLVRAPRHCIVYVVTHELCHLREHNHGPKFYALLERHFPRWRATKTELDSLAETLLADRRSGRRRQSLVRQPSSPAEPVLGRALRATRGPVLPPDGEDEE
jgi:hypothetical protein